MQTCPFLEDCSSTDAYHLKRYHPNAHLSRDGVQRDCMYGHECYRRALHHLAKFRHPIPSHHDPRSPWPIFPKFRSLFPALSCYQKHQPKTLLEQSILGFLNFVLSKPKWWDGLVDNIENWRVESNADALIVSYCLEELTYLATKYNSDSLFVIAPVPETFISDHLIKTNLKDKFVSSVLDFENNLPDDDIVNRILINPSLYCIVSNQTLDIKNRRIDLKKATNFSSNSHQCDYQWIPSDISVHESNGSVKFLSPINNLDKKSYPRLYQCVTKIFEKFVPLFEKTLTILANPTEPNRVNFGDCDVPPLVDIKLNDIRNALTLGTPLIKIPKNFQPCDSHKYEIDLKGKQIQVIVKLSTIHLTPENPRFEGTDFINEGSTNERIVANGIYCFSSQNITPSKIKFTAKTEEPPLGLFNCEMQDLYGLQQGERLVQSFGEIEICEDRCLVFPNFFEHKHMGFGLVDVDRDGWRKVLSFYLVDPSIKIFSTNDVLMTSLDLKARDVFVGLGNILPYEVALEIAKYQNGLVSKETAEYQCNDLERTRAMLGHNERLSPRHI